MAATVSRDDFVRNLTDSGLFSREEIDSCLNALSLTGEEDGEDVARQLIAAGKLTAYQAAAVRDRNFGELVIGSYQVLDRLGAGGMGTVYKARHRRMKRVVAVKVLSRSVAQAENFVQRFQREVEAVARLSHPNIVTAHDAGEAEVGHFLVMEFVNGRDLATEVQRRGPLPVAEAVDCVVQAAQALDYAHGQGVIHRDIKPANLLRDAGGLVKVADLGLARIQGAAQEDGGSALTMTGMAMGTADYMPPEQAMGLATVDHRADIYSLGCTLYYLIAGRGPYQGTSPMAILLKHRDAPIPALRAARGDVPEALDDIFRRMVAKEPGDRFASMGEVVRALESVPVVWDPKDEVLATQLPPTLPPAAINLAGGPETTRSPAPADSTGPTIVGAPPDQAGTGDMVVLLVEPSRAQAVIIRKYLHELGVQNIVTTTTAQKALELARGAPPNVVISAMHLADMTGVRLAQEMRAEKKLTSTGFVLITSQAEAADGNLLNQVGHAVRLPKPFTLAQLAQAVAAAKNASAKSGRKVLVADDSAAARSHIRAVLAGLGLSQVVEAADGAEAVAFLESERFDLVVTDYHMPRLDGRQLIEFIRRRSSCPRVPVIMTTTETDPVRLDTVRQLGVFAICDKSFAPDVVRGVIDTMG